jgi:hypothetical protein
MLKLQPNPTFKAKVGIPVPGEDKRPIVTFMFNHMSKAEFDKFDPKGENDVQTLMRICAGWEGVDADFSQENLSKLCDAYPGSAFTIAEAYAKELHGGRLGN